MYIRVSWLGYTINDKLHKVSKLNPKKYEPKSVKFIQLI